MKYLYLPIHLVRFWYIEGLDTFIRTWRNLILLLEEDLTVGLMWRLIFTPLFHDSSIVGRILSFLFRFTRIIIGLFAYLLATVLILAISIYWFLLPILAIINIPFIVSAVLFLAGVGLFILHVSLHPHKKVWQIKSREEFWQCAEIKKKDLNFNKLLKSSQINYFLTFLEIKPEMISNSDIEDWQGVGYLAYQLAKDGGSEYIRASHFFVAALFNIPHIENELIKYNLALEDFRQTLFYLEKKRNQWKKVWIWNDDFFIHHLKGINRGWLGTPTPNLDRSGEDLTKTAATQGSINFIRTNGVVEHIVNILSQQTGKNVVVVAEPGAGKSALVRHLARLIVRGDAPEALAIKRLMLLDLTKLLSGIKTQGELAEKIKDIFEEVEFAQNVILAVEEIHNLGMGEAGLSLNLYSLILPYLESDKFQFIGTTEPENYSKILEKNGAFARLFIKVELSPASIDDTINILESRSINFAKNSKIKTTYLAIKSVAELSAKMVHDRVLPDSAMSILKEAQTQAQNGWITKKVVTKIISERVKVPIVEIGNADNSKLLNLEQDLHQKIIDQEQAVKVISDSLRRSATGLREEKRPIGSFLFVGPTGVGKTEVAKALSEVYFKTEGAFIRFDMSEYQSSESVSRLIGGSEGGGLLTEAIRSKPYALLLLDEFEKADPKILTLFLQVLEDGRLTDGAGRTIDFTNTIIIATSNAASLTIAKGLETGQTLESLDKQVNDEILQVFKPELINRFDDVVLFKPLSQEDLQKIVRLKLNQLQNQMKEKGYLMEFSPELVGELAKRGFDPVLGARPLRRLIQDTLEANLSRMILENKLVKGQTFKVGVELVVS
ncbi:MAG: AAA family ATPase [Candidatus Daviesbacteria bacterium]|nr:AAA family ATPase [Candidatus Daviesbacteria bacterium]